MFFPVDDDIGAVGGWTVEEVPKSPKGFAADALDAVPLLGKDMLVKSPLPPKGSLEGAPEILNAPEEPKGSFVDVRLALKGSDDEADTGRPVVRVDEGEAVPKDIDAKSELKSCAVDRDGGWLGAEDDPNGSLFVLVLPPKGSKESCTAGADEDDESPNKSSSSNDAAGCAGCC